MFTQNMEAIRSSETSVMFSERNENLESLFFMAPRSALGLPQPLTQWVKGKGKVFPLQAKQALGDTEC